MSKMRKKSKPNRPMFKISGLPDSPPISRIDTLNAADDYNVRFPSREADDCAELCIGDDMILLLDSFDCDSIGQALLVMAAEMERRGAKGRLAP